MDPVLSSEVDSVPSECNPVPSEFTSVPEDPVLDPVPDDPELDSVPSQFSPEFIPVPSDPLELDDPWESDSCMSIDVVVVFMLSGLQVVVEVVLSVVGAPNICSQFSASLKHEGGPDLQPIHV